MPTNDQILLNDLLTQRKAQLAPDVPDPDFFELFVAEQVLKDYDLSYDEIKSGIVDGGGDGGVDGIYAFINGELISEDIDISVFKKDISLELVIIQAKTSDGFPEGTIERLISTSRDLLDLSTDIETLLSVYNAGLLATVSTFRKASRDLASRFPRLTFKYLYATKGMQPDPKVVRKVAVLDSLIHELFSSSVMEFRFLGAPALLELARRPAITTLDLRIYEGPMTTGEVNYVALVALTEYYRFITDNGALRRSVFEANVRDYQGSTEVNDAIRATLESSTSEDFWWLNNGVTIVASNATIAGKTLTLEAPQIVNGFQTSMEIHKYFHSHPDKDDSRNVLIRVLVPTDEATRDRIIKATNSQTPIPSASLRATDKIQRDIETYFGPRGLFYDRRKNFYKNQGRPIDKIVGIPYLAQAVMAIVLRRPNDSRARPSSLLNDDDDYRRIFDPEYPIGLFFACARLMKAVDAFLKSDVAKFVGRDRNNIRFHLGMFAAVAKAGRLDIKPVEYPGLGLEEVSHEFLAECLPAVWEIFEALKASSSDAAPDQIAKSRSFVEALQGKLVKLTGDGRQS